LPVVGKRQVVLWHGPDQAHNTDLAHGPLTSVDMSVEDSLNSTLTLGGTSDLCIQITIAVIEVAHDPLDYLL